MLKSQTKGSKKIMNLLQDLFEQVEFLEDTDRIYELLEIPDKIRLGKSHKWAIKIATASSTNDLKEEWERVIFRTLNIELNKPKMQKMIPIWDGYSSSMVKSFILVKDPHAETLAKQTVKTSEVCELDTAAEEYSFCEADYGMDEKMCAEQNESLKIYLFRFPVVLRIHPTAGLRDVQEYLNANWNKIEKLQKEYSKGKVSVKNTRVYRDTQKKERNKRIMELRKSGESYKRIARTIRTEGLGDLDEGHIGAILSQEKNKRKA